MTPDEYKALLRNQVEGYFGASLAYKVRFSYRGRAHVSQHEFKVFIDILGREEVEVTRRVEIFRDGLEGTKVPWGVLVHDPERRTGRDPRTGRFARTFAFQVAVFVDDDGLARA
jgi:hypothetical protein